MFSTLRNRFGIPGVISVIALVFAMFGGAYAASNSGNGGEATTSAKAKAKVKVKQGPRGPKGAKGKAGPAGPAGPAGAKGDPGAKGDVGGAGSNGTNGTDGQGVTVSTIPSGGEEGKCVGVGGAKFTAGAAKGYACNGEEGEPGPAGQTGSPWVANGTLPANSTETGTWSFGTVTSPENFVPISFAIPLAASLGETQVHYINAAGKEVDGTLQEVTSTKCLGTAAAPKALSGHLCIYTGQVNGSAILFNSSIIDPSKGISSSVVGASTTGAVMDAVVLSGSVSGVGTWAVTG